MPQTPSSPERQVGFEIEFSGIPLERAAELVQELFGGDIECATSAEAVVGGTRLGDFIVELDAEPVKRFAAYVSEESQQPEVLAQVSDALSQSASEAVKELGPKVVPTEIVAPPIPESAIQDMDELRAALHKEGGKGTKSSVKNAFGLHINPEVKEPDSARLLRVMVAFSLLYPWLVSVHRVDLMRRVAPFIKPYSLEYVEALLKHDVPPSIEALIKEYHAFNPTRNRALDMLPMFKHLEPDLVVRLYGEEEKINARPTFHYRLPNSEVANKNWSLTREWCIWRAVEKAADSDDCLAELKAAWQEQNDKALSFLSSDDYIQTIAAIVEKHDVCDA